MLLLDNNLVEKKPGRLRRLIGEIGNNDKLIRKS